MQRRWQHAKEQGGQCLYCPVVAELAVEACSDPILLQQPAQYTCTAGRRNQSSLSWRRPERIMRSHPQISCVMLAWTLACVTGCQPRAAHREMLPLHTKGWSLFHPKIITLLCTNSSANTSHNTHSLLLSFSCPARPHGSWQPLSLALIPIRSWLSSRKKDI